mmetsp:Transcript_31258/g.48448  ORF Transcript_31258/g.48448 Transcript_31258/m.48448 type:complete len:85 (+) Transcript_31258:1261-1515(+)
MIFQMFLLMTLEKLAVNILLTLNLLLLLLEVLAVHQIITKFVVGLTGGESKVKHFLCNTTNFLFMRKVNNTLFQKSQNKMAVTS